MMPFPSTPEFNPLAEQYAERLGLEVCLPATFTAGLKEWGIAPCIQASTPRGKPLTVSAGGIYNARAKFFATLDLAAEPYHLTLVGEKFALLFQDWLTHTSTERYRSLTSLVQRRWRGRICTLVVVRQLMERKYTLSLTHGKQIFVDASVCDAMYHLHLLHSLPGELARMVHHIVRDQERATALIEQFFDQLDVRMQGHQFGLLAPLPPLPPGVQPPFGQLLPGQGSSEQDASGQDADEQGEQGEASHEQ